MPNFGRSPQPVRRQAQKRIRWEVAGGSVPAAVVDSDFKHRRRRPHDKKRACEFLLADRRQISERPLVHKSEGEPSPSPSSPLICSPLGAPLGKDNLRTKIRDFRGFDSSRI